ncbi:hypothetical protein [Nocardia sp. NPDC050710]|uniref:hypothetical protein n=1 Tax=Nocardia sp. NPDC050710 TaxID=3157220 RepID=UPI0033DBC385
MAGELNANPDQLIPAAKTGIGLQGNHEGYLKSLIAVQDELQAAVKSQGGGVAIQQAMTQAWEKGSALSTSLQEIINTLLDTGIKVDVSDMENAAQVQRATAFGLDGVNSVAGDMSGGKVNTHW